MAFEHGEDGFQNRFTLERDFVVPESQDRVASRVQIACSLIVLRVLCVLASVEFDDQLPTPTDEIRDVGTDPDLPVETIAVQQAIAQFEPEKAFGVGRLAAHPASEGFGAPRRLGSKGPLTRPLRGRPLPEGERNHIASVVPFVMHVAT